MGVKFLTKKDSHFSVIFLLIISLFINFGLASSVTSQIVPDEEISINDITGDTGSFWLVDNYIIMYRAYPTLYFYDISNPAEPAYVQANFTINTDTFAFAHYDKTLLFAQEGSVYYNGSMMMYDLNHGLTNPKTILSWDTFSPQHMLLTNDTFYCLGSDYLMGKFFHLQFY